MNSGEGRQQKKRSREQRTSPYLLPRRVTKFFMDSGLIDDVMYELEYAAMNDPNQCAGYFPGSPSANNANLPACQRFAHKYGYQNGRAMNYNFSWLRRSLVPQEPLYGMHVDANAGTGLGKRNKVQQSWRMLLNLGDEPRTLGYSTQAIARLELVEINGLRACQDYDLSMATSVAIPPRDNHLVRGVIFCASEVLHTGEDGDSGHFLASYGREEVIPRR